MKTLRGAQPAQFVLEAVGGEVGSLELSRREIDPGEADQVGTPAGIRPPGTTV